MKACTFLSRAVFLAKMSYMIHFINNETWLKDVNANNVLKIKDRLIDPSSKVEILEGILDAGLPYYSY